MSPKETENKHETDQQRRPVVGARGWSTAILVAAFGIDPETYAVPYVALCYLGNPLLCVLEGHVQLAPGASSHNLSSTRIPAGAMAALLKRAEEA